VAVVPKGKGQLDSDRVQNPHDAEATYAVKGQGAHKKEHVGFKVQVAETVSEAVLAPGEPTGNYLTGIVTHRAHESDEAGEVKMEQEQATMGLAKPPVQYVDGAYVSAQSWRKRTPRDARSLDRRSRRRAKRAGSAWRIFRFTWSNARRFVRPESAAPNAADWRRRRRAK